MEYKVYNFDDTRNCSLYLEKDCPCPLEHMCGDILITDMSMPTGTGLDFIKNQRKHGCKIKFFLIISGSMSYQDEKETQKEGIKVLHKPFPFEKLYSWVEECKKDIDPNRKLSNWFHDER